MKRDFDFIRDLLLFIEDKSDGINDLYTENFYSVFPDKAKVSYHIFLLNDGGLIKCKITSLGDNETGFIVSRLTSSGHDYLDLVRDQNVWNKTKDKIMSATSSISLAIIKTAAEGITSAMINKTI